MCSYYYKFIYVYNKVSKANKLVGKENATKKIKAGIYLLQ